MGRWIRPLVLVTAGLSLTGPARGIAESAVILDSLIIRVYDNAGVLATDRARALKRAAEVLARAEVSVEWMECGVRKTSGPATACDAPPTRDELVVRLIVGPPGPGHDRRSLGYSLVDSETGTGTLGTVFVDRVDWLAAGARADRAEVMGRAIAHEIGHLVLGSYANSASGLMRAIWTIAELSRNRRED